jgi:hypothetical protein
VVIVEEHAAIVKRIFEMYLSGYGFNAIAKKLNDEEVKSPAYYQKVLLNKDLTRIQRIDRQSVTTIN